MIEGFFSPTPFGVISTEGILSGVVDGGAGSCTPTSSDSFRVYPSQLLSVPTLNHPGGPKTLIPSRFPCLVSVFGPTGRVFFTKLPRPTPFRSFGLSLRVREQEGRPFCQTIFLVLESSLGLNPRLRIKRILVLIDTVEVCSLDGRDSKLKGKHFDSFGV